MRPPTARACVAALLLATSGRARAETISLSTALDRATSHPDIVAAQTDLEAAGGARVAANTIAYNPELNASGGPRYGAGDTTADIEVTVSQTFELGSKRSRRTAVADARVRVARADLARARQRVFWRVRRAYTHALVARERVRATGEGETFALELRELARERLDGGKGTKLEVNQAIAEVGRARRDQLVAEHTYEVATFELSSAVGARGDVELEPGGTFEDVPDIDGAEDDLVSRAIGGRPDLLATLEQRKAAEASRRFEDSLRVPNLSVGATYAREETADLFLVGVTIEIPLWNRNQGARQSARARVVRARVVANYAQQQVERQVRLAWRRHDKARDAVRAFDTKSLGTLGENLQLTREAFERGKLSIVEFAVLRSSFVEVQLAYLDAVDEQVDSYFAVQLALGEQGAPQ